MLAEKEKHTNLPPTPFDFNESQRSFSKLEWDFCRTHRDELSRGSVFLTFSLLVSLRTQQGIAFPSKDFLREFCRLGSHNTLDAQLKILVTLGLIRINKKARWDPIKKRGSTRWTYTFPLAGPSARVVVVRDNEKVLKPAPAVPPSPNDEEESSGRKINNTDIPPTITSFPQPANKPTPTEERREEIPETAVFLTNEPENQQTVSPKHQEKPIVEETVKPLTEDLGKDEPKVIAEINDLVTTIKREKESNGRVKTLADDVVCLKKIFGAMPVLTGLKCMMGTLSTVINPGGWLRVNLNNPAWLNRFRDKLNEKNDIEQFHRRNLLATMARLAEDAKQSEINARLSEEVDRLLAGLSVAERDSLWVEARAILTAKRGFITEGTVRSQARLLVRENYISKRLL